MQFRNNVQSVVSFMSSRKVPRSLQRRVRRYLEFRFRYRASCVGVGVTFIQDLSPWLQLELTRHLIGELICNHPYFKAMPTQALSHVCLSAVSTLCSGGDVVAERGKTSEFVVFVAMGRLASLTHSGKVSMTGSYEIAQFHKSLQVPKVKRNRWTRVSLQTMHSSNESLGSVDEHVTAEFGDKVAETFEKGMWFDDVCLFKDVVGTHTVVTLVDAELVTTSRSAVLSLREKFPELAVYHAAVDTVIIEHGLQKAGFLCKICSKVGHCEKSCPIASSQTSAI